MAQFHNQSVTNWWGMPEPAPVFHGLRRERRRALTLALFRQWDYFDDIWNGPSPVPKLHANGFTYSEWPEWVFHLLINPHRVHADRFRLFTFLVLNGMLPRRALHWVEYWQRALSDLRHSTLLPHQAADGENMVRDASGPNGMSQGSYRIFRVSYYDFNEQRVIPSYPFSLAQWQEDMIEIARRDGANHAPYLERVWFSRVMYLRLHFRNAAQNVPHHAWWQHQL